MYQFYLFVDCADVSSPGSEYQSDDNSSPVRPTRKFASSEINGRRYYDEVRRILISDMDCLETPQPIHLSRFINKRDAQRLNEYRLPDPSFDAWMCVTGQQRSVFDCRAFMKQYKGLFETILQIRKTCNVSLRITCSVTR